ncbi:MAG: hypothetical protein QY317_16125 [Candidatus Jettenia caeni]|nr:MAG: hypothetical protein QY317_16125 [Candidatus Jettenia caeni]
MEKTERAEEVKTLLEEALTLFSDAIDMTQALQIDTDCEDTVVNHNLQDSFAVYLNTIIEHYRGKTLNDLIRALLTAEFIKVYGVTRIVGYYSRVQNWNKSKVGELNDRHKGNYWYKDETRHKYVESTDNKGACTGNACSL